MKRLLWCFLIFSSVIASLALSSSEAVIFNENDLALSDNSDVLDLRGSCPKAYSINVSVTAVTQSAAAMASASAIDATANTFTKASHGLIDGVVGQFTTSSALPTGISAATNYWVVSSTTNTFKVSASEGGDAVDISDVGTGNQTFTPTALSATLKLQQSNDQSSWVDVTNSSQNVTTTNSFAFSAADVAFDYVRLVYTDTAGAVDMVARARVKKYCGFD